MSYNCQMGQKMSNLINCESKFYFVVLLLSKVLYFIVFFFGIARFITPIILSLKKGRK